MSVSVVILCLNYSHFEVASDSYPLSWTCRVTTESHFVFTHVGNLRVAYEEVLSTMVASLGDQPQDVLRGAADEVLAWLKVSMCPPARERAAPASEGETLRLRSWDIKRGHPN